MQPLPAGGLLGFLRLNAVQEEGAELREIGLRGNAIDGARQNSSPSQTGDLNFSVKLFAKSFSNPAKNIDDCVTYILNYVKNSGCNGFTDGEIFGQAIHYYPTICESAALIKSIESTKINCITASLYLRKNHLVSRGISMIITPQ